MPLRIAAVFCALWLLFPGAKAQTAPPARSAQTAAAAPAPAAPDATPDENLKASQADLKSVEQALARKGLTDSDLQNLATQVDPAAARAQQVIDEVTPRLEAVQARLKQIGPAPAQGAPPESPELTAARREQLTAQNALNSDLAQAKVALLEAGQLRTRISAMRRDLFVSNVFVQSNGLFSPTLWSETYAEAPQDFETVRTALSGLTAEFERKLDGWTWAVFVAALSAVALLYLACDLLVRRILARAPGTEEPTRFQKALAAVWVFFLTALPPVLSIVALVSALRAFGLADPAVDPLLGTIIVAVGRVSFALAVAQGLLAPGRPNWRLLDLSTPTCEALLRLAVGVASIISIGKILNSIADQVAFSVPMSLAIRGVAALAVALMMAVSLRGVAAEDNLDECLGPRVEQKANWGGLLRFAAWAAIVVLLISVSIGYVAFSAFLLDQLVWVSFLGSALCVSLALVDEGLSAAFLPNGVLGAALSRSLGMRRDSLAQVGILSSGVSTVALCLLVGFLILAPWRIESTDVFGGIRAAIVGFQIGGFTISVSAIIGSIAIFVLGLLLTRWVQRWFDTRLLPAMQMDAGLRNSIRTSIGYLGIFAASALALAQLGVDFQKIAIVAGALSVGIGFGLQSIVSNFVSGLIILWERAIRVGDLVVIGDDQGHVTRINVRSTQIETADRVTMIVPNSNLVTGVVKNWVRSDRGGRIKIALGFAPPADPEQVRTILTDCARAHPSVLKAPAPQALLTSIDGSLKFELTCFVEDIEAAGRVKSELNFTLFARLKEAGLEAPAAAAPPPSSSVIVRLAGWDPARDGAAAKIIEDAEGK